MRGLEDFYILRPVMAEGCSVTLTELDTLYNFLGLAELHTLLDVKLTKNKLDSAKIDLNTPKS